MIDTVMACFQEAPVAGKLQNGSAWWFNDSEAGMRDQMTSLANNGVFGNFVGMLTDFRSFLSYPRHEYFRRVMCGLLGEWSRPGGSRAIWSCWAAWSAIFPTTTLSVILALILQRRSK